MGCVPDCTALRRQAIDALALQQAMHGLDRELVVP
jgi:hypothetical protein